VQGSGDDAGGGTEGHGEVGVSLMGATVLEQGSVVVIVVVVQSNVVVVIQSASPPRFSTSLNRGSAGLPRTNAERESSISEIVFHHLSELQ